MIFQFFEMNIIKKYFFTLDSEKPYQDLPGKVVEMSQIGFLSVSVLGGLSRQTGSFLARCTFNVEI